MFGPIGMPELIIIMVVALIVFGPRKLPELGRAIGQTLQEFKKGTRGLVAQVDREIQSEGTAAAGRLETQEASDTVDEQRRPDRLGQMQVEAR